MFAFLQKSRLYFVTSRKGRVSRNAEATIAADNPAVTSRKGRVSRNEMEIQTEGDLVLSRPVRGV